jgi:hypothetical protein
MGLRGWFVTAAVLAFLAGGGTCLVADRLADSGDEDREVGDAEGYLEVFEREIGIRDDAQRRALRAAYDQYWRDLQSLTQRIAAEHQEELAEIDVEFVRKVSNLLTDEEQRRRWRERTGGILRNAGDADTDAGEEQPPGNEDADRK